MKKWTMSLLVGVVGCVAAASVAFAGHKQLSTVWMTSTSAGGTLGDARSSSNSSEYIQCQVFAGGGAPSVYCSARDASGKFLSCNSSDAGAVQAASGFGPTAYVTFGVNNGACSYVWVINSSYNSPVVP